MDKNNYLHPVHLSSLPVVVARLWFPVRAVCFFLGEGKKAVQGNYKAMDGLNQKMDCMIGLIISIYLNISIL